MWFIDGELRFIAKAGAGQNNPGRSLADCRSQPQEACHVLRQALCGVNCNLMHSTSWLCPGDSMNRQALNLLHRVLANKKIPLICVYLSSSWKLQTLGHDWLAMNINLRSTSSLHIHITCNMVSACPWTETSDLLTPAGLGLLRSHSTHILQRNAQRPTIPTLCTSSSASKTKNNKDTKPHAWAIWSLTGHHGFLAACMLCHSTQNGRALSTYHDYLPEATAAVASGALYLVLF